jgi:hypothetical protein
MIDIRLRAAGGKFAEVVESLPGLSRFDSSGDDLNVEVASQVDARANISSQTRH